MGTANPATVLAEARKALFIMAGFIAVIWIIQIVNWAGHYQLSVRYGIRPHDVGSLPEDDRARVEQFFRGGPLYCANCYTKAPSCDDCGWHIVLERTGDHIRKLHTHAH